MKGFSLIEFTVTLALLMLLSSLAAGFNYFFYSRNELQALKDELKTAVHYARMQSFIIGKTLYLENISRSNDWSCGMVLYEVNSNGSKIPLHKWQWNHPHWQIYWSGFSSRNSILFSPHPHFAAMNGQFRIINARTQQQTTLVINRLGRIKESTE
ncbi:pilus assembly protein [Legionella israelensis]|uniref:Type II secretion system protein H n=1 Tax=Legionella israelensis TaxID=454 RepID=A0AAX1EGL0_9GAMM|nr:GspH/FimT family protein [Legionella israelensis]QBR84231.1 pilus assembly protein [Legionella israelensis]